MESSIPIAPEIANACYVMPFKNSIKKINRNATRSMNAS